MISTGLSDPNKRAWEQMTEGWIRTKCSEIESLLCSICRRISGDFCTFLVSRCKFGDRGQCPVWKCWKSVVLQRCVGRAGAAVSGAGQGEPPANLRPGSVCCGGAVGHQSILPNPLPPVLAEGRAGFLGFIGQELEAVKMNSREKAVCKILPLEVCLFVVFPSEHHQSVHGFQKAPGRCRERHSLFCCAGDTANPLTLRSGTSFLSPCF